MSICLRRIQRKSRGSRELHPRQPNLSLRIFLNSAGLDNYINRAVKWAHNRARNVIMKRREFGKQEDSNIACATKRAKRARSPVMRNNHRTNCDDGANIVITKLDTESVVLNVTTGPSNQTTNCASVETQLKISSNFPQLHRGCVWTNLTNEREPAMTFIAIFLPLTSFFSVLNNTKRFLIQARPNPRNHPRASAERRRYKSYAQIDGSYI